MNGTCPWWLAGHGHAGGGRSTTVVTGEFPQMLPALLVAGGEHRPGVSDHSHAPPTCCPWAFIHVLQVLEGERL